MIWRLALLGLAVLSACSSKTPGPADAFIIPPGPNATAPGTEVNVCYSRWHDSPADILRLINRDCEGPTFVSTGVDLDRCPLLQPMRATYRCQAISDNLLADRPVLPSRALKN